MEEYILKNIRKKLGLTQEQVAEEMDVSVNTVQNWERDMRFRNSDQLHELLDFYGINDAVRSIIVQKVYGRRSEFCPDVEKKESESVLKQAVHIISSEKDAQNYLLYPLDKTITALSVVDARIKCLRTAIRFAEDFYQKKRSYPIYGLETAITIDKIGEEYDIKLGAVGIYTIQESNVKCEGKFPMGLDESTCFFSEEFGKKMNYEEYINALQSKVDVKERSKKEDIEKTLPEMRRDCINLEILREFTLEHICQEGIWEQDVDLSACIDMECGTFFEIVTLVKTGMSFSKTSNEARMRDFLNDPSRVSIDRRGKWKKSKGIYCGCEFFEGETVDQAVSVLNNPINFVFINREPYIQDEWQERCRTNSMLQDYIKKIS